MLISDQFLFLHYPKTAGKSLSRYMLEAWPGPIHGYVSPGQVKELQPAMRPGVTLEVGRGHENMMQARRIAAARGTPLDTLRAIFVCIRNPYDLAVSTYFFLRQNYALHKGKPNFERANALGFEEFWCESSIASAESWLTLDGEVPSNQRLIRFEHMAEDLQACATEFAFNPATLPHFNSSKRDHYSEYIETPACEAAVYRNFRYLFDAGFYQRELIAG